MKPLHVPDQIIIIAAKSIIASIAKLTIVTSGDFYFCNSFSYSCYGEKSFVKIEMLGTVFVANQSTVPIRHYTEQLSRLDCFRDDRTVGSDFIY